MGEIRQDTIKGVKWTALERFSIQGVQFVLGLIVARLLVPADYGLVGMLGIFLAVSQTLIDSGMSNAIIRKLDRTENDFSTLFYFNIIVSTACAAAIFFGAPLIANFFRQPVLAPIARVMSFNLIIGSLGSIQAVRMTIAIDFKTQAKINFIAAVVSGLCGLGMAYTGMGVWALVWQSIIANVLRVAFLWVWGKWHPRFVFSKKSFKDLFGYGSKLMASGLLNTFYTQMTTLVIGKFFTPASLGNYSRGTGIASMPCDAVTGILGRVTFPIFAKIQNDETHLITVYRNYIRLTMMVLVFIIFLLVAVSRPLVLLLLTQKWEGAIIFLQVFAFAAVFDPLCSINLNLLMVKGRSDLFLRLEIIKKIIAVIILICAIPLGVLAICVSKVIYTQIAVYINTYYTGRLFGLSYWQQIKDFSPYFLYSLISCSPAAILSYSLNPFLSIIIGIPIAIIFYLFILKLRHDENFLTFILPQLLKLRTVMTSSKFNLFNSL